MTYQPDINKTYMQDTAPDPLLLVLHEGDIWIDTSTGNVIWRWDGSQWVIAQLGEGSVTPEAINALSVVALAISTGTLSVGTIGGAQILASDIATTDIVISPDGGTVLVYSLSGQTVVNLTTAGANTW